MTSIYNKIPEPFCEDCPYRFTREQDEIDWNYPRGRQIPVELSNVRTCDKDYFSQIERKCLVDGSPLDK